MQDWTLVLVFKWQHLPIVFFLLIIASFLNCMFVRSTKELKVKSPHQNRLVTDFLVKTCKQQTGRQVRVAETCGPFPFFLHHHHLGDLWSECQRWKYTNRYSLIIYSQVYIPKTVTFHYFQLCLKTIPSEADPFSPLMALVSEYKASQQARYSKQRQRSEQHIQAAPVRTGPEHWLDFLCVTYTVHRFTAHTEFFSHSVGTLLGQAAGVLMLDLRQTQVCFTSAAGVKNLTEIHSAPVDVQITSHNSMQQIICLGWGYWMQKYIPSS